jgi:RNA polymerase sigma-70 factor (sigma-E family)
MESRSADSDEHFRALVAERYVALTRTAFLLTGDRGHAQDLVQQSLLKVYEALRRGADPTSMEAYTRTTMLRLSLRWRQTRWRSEVPAVIPDIGSTSDPDLGLQMRLALMALPRDQRAVIVLRYFEGLSEAETAEALGVAAGTVKSRSSRALASLRHSGLLREDDPSEDEHAAI